MKTQESLQAQMRWLGLGCLCGVVVCIAGVSIWTPMFDADIAHRRFSFLNILWLLPVPFVTGLVAILTGLALRARTEAGAFVEAVGLFLMSYIGIAISLWPMIVPHHYDLWQAASSPKTQGSLLAGTVFLLPTVLIYTAWSYWVFRGKVRADIGYH
jgi:cytochrome d ubiquinol oxidase subunit II